MTAKRVPGADDVYKPPHMPWYERDFWSFRVRLLKPMERLMYRSLLQQGWHSSNPPYLPTDDEQLMRLADAPSPEVWKAHREPILQMFTKTEDGAWYFHPKALALMSKVTVDHEGRARGGRTSRRGKPAIFAQQLSGSSATSDQQLSNSSGGPRKDEFLLDWLQGLPSKKQTSAVHPKEPTRMAKVTIDRLARGGRTSRKGKKAISVEQPSNGSAFPTQEETSNNQNDTQTQNKTKKGIAAASAAPTLAEESISELRKGIRLEIEAHWNSNNPGVRLPWDRRANRNVNLLLTANPSWTFEQYQRCIRNRFQSQCNHSEAPFKWVNQLTDYYGGPLDRYGLPRKATEQSTAFHFSGNNCEYSEGADVIYDNRT